MPKKYFKKKGETGFNKSFNKKSPFNVMGPDHIKSITKGLESENSSLLGTTSEEGEAAGKNIGKTIANLAKIGAKIAASDRKLKKNIKYLFNSPSGLPVYNFEYINCKYGEGVFQGVMSDEIPNEAVVSVDGYDMVDYSKIDVEFKKIK